MVSDKDVVYLVLNRLLKRENASGVIVDGFPRTKIQGECIKHLYDKMREYKRKYEKFFILQTKQIHKIIIFNITLTLTLTHKPVIDIPYRL